MAPDTPRDPGPESTADSSASPDGSTAAEQSTPPSESPEATGPFGLSRRTVIRLLVGLGLGLPILIELRTVFEWVERSLFGSGGDDSDPTPSATPDPAEGVAVGDELLPATPQTETLVDASLRETPDGRTLTLTVEIDNTGDEPYTVQFGACETRDGRTVVGTKNAVGVPAGDRATLTGEWDLPPGGRPRWLTVTTAVGAGASADHRTTLAPIPVEAPG